MKLKLIIVSLLFSGSLLAQTATEIIKKADAKMKGETFYGEMSMTIVRPTWKRTVKFKTWGLGNEYSLALVTYPPKEKGQTFLNRENEMWTWNPIINRLIKLPPSMLSQGWMGSDYSNDDLLKESSLVNDYVHTILAEEQIDGELCWKIELMPKEDAAVVWGKVLKWVSKAEYNQLKTEYYDEDEYLVKTEIASNVQLMGGKRIPTHIEIISADEPKKKTLVDITKVEFDKPYSKSFFSQQNMKRLR
ncbi:MAG: outer membrane lipoprotein-sorting protein [Bacteroidales bacterium]|nr:outer membrane lipoprotein-sorting protein [Bacteroidales bacterium]